MSTVSSANSNTSTLLCTSPTSTVNLSHAWSRPPRMSSVSRSPCPALNTLANHGFINREGRNIAFFELLHALEEVYNISSGLALVLTVAGFVTCGKITFGSSPSSSYDSSSTSASTSTPKSWVSSIWNSIPFPRWRLDLDSLLQRGSFHIAHNAALVHPNDLPSSSPDPKLVSQLLSFATPCHIHNGKSSNKSSSIRAITFKNFVCAHVRRIKETRSPLSFLQNQIALGECGLCWEVMGMSPSPSSPSSASSLSPSPSCYDEDVSVPVEQRRVRGLGSKEKVLPAQVLTEWIYQERLPEDWFINGKPKKPIGLAEARSKANEVGKLSERLQKNEE